MRLVVLNLITLLTPSYPLRAHFEHTSWKLWSCILINVQMIWSYCCYCYKRRSCEYQLGFFSRFFLLYVKKIKWWIISFYHRFHKLDNHHQPCLFLFLFWTLAPTMLLCFCRFFLAVTKPVWVLWRGKTSNGLERSPHNVYYLVFKV